MFYKPKYCCECGEKIERNDWKIWTNRRFCENCELERQTAVWLPRIGVFVGLICALLGVGSFLQTAEKPLTITSASVKNTESNQKKTQPSPNGDAKFLAQTGNSANNAAPPAKNLTPNDPKSPENPRLQLRENSAEKQNAETEAVYFCGAQTKKGTPCSRRVKGGGRCWQHAGQAALLPPEKLLISR